MLRNLTRKTPIGVFLFIFGLLLTGQVFAVGGTWGPLGGSDAGNGLSSDRLRGASIAVDSNNRPYIVYFEGSTTATRKVWFKRYNGSSWVGMSGSGSGDVILENLSVNLSVSSPPMIVLDKNDIPHIAFGGWTTSGSTSNFIYYFYWNGSNWVGRGGSNTGAGLLVGDPATVSTNTGARLAINPVNQNPYVIWDTGNEIYLKYWDGSAWAGLGTSAIAGQGIDNDGLQDFWATVAVSANGVPYATYRQDSATLNVIVKYWNGSSWVGPASGTATGDKMEDGTFSPVIAAYGNTPYVIYQANNALATYLKYFNGSAWVALGNSATGTGVAPSITGNERVYGSWLTMARNGRPYVTVEFGDQALETVNSYASYYDGTSWQAFGNSMTKPGGMSSTPGARTMPFIAAAPNGSPYMVWAKDGASPDARVYMRYFSPTGNNAPTLAQNAGLTVTPGGTGAINNTRLSTTDAESGASNLTYQVLSQPVNGSLNLTSFTQSQINSSGVTYTHNGSATTTDSFTFIVSDDFHIIGTYTFAITIQAAQPALSINDVTQLEGNSGTTNFTFTVTRSGNTSGSSSVNYSTADNTATAGSDYASASGTLSFVASQTTQTLSVIVNGDTTFEPNETFFVNLSTPSNATISDGQGLGTITNDDVDPCAPYVFPYTLAGNTPAELRAAIECANSNGTADVINLNSQTVTLTNSYGNFNGSTGLPAITSQLTLQNGTVTRAAGSAEFRLITVSAAGNLTLSSVTLTNGRSDSASYGGGALLNQGTVTITNSIVSSNSSVLDAGAIHNSSATMTIVNSKLTGNEASAGGAGGAIGNSDGSLTISNSVVSGNLASLGGGIYNNSAGTIIANNVTVAGNRAFDGGGFYNDYGTLTLNNTLVYGNEADGAEDDIFTPVSVSQNNSLVGVNPSFVNLLDASDNAPTSSGDYRLGNLSAAVDAGSNSLIPGGITTDLDGNLRRYNDTVVSDTGVGTAPIVDIGAYEKQTNSTPRSVTVSKTTVTPAEGGATDTYTVVLDIAPSADVIVTVTGDSQASVSPTSLTFTTSNWSVSQTVTVTAVNDAVAEGSHTGTITHSASGGGYNSVSIASVTASITDNDTAGVTVTESSGSTNVTEGGATDTYSVVLNSQPTADVTITVTADTQVSVNATSLTFTTSNWSVAQTVTVTAVNDAVAEGSHTGTITHSASGGGYGSVLIASVIANITDNDTTGVTVNKTTVNATEGGATDTYTVVLNTQPTSDVTVTVTGDAQASVSPISLTFTTSNWSVAQTVTVTAVDDVVVEGNHTGTISHSASGGGYGSVSIASVTASITDNEIPSVSLSKTSVNVDESGATDTYTVVLDFAPSADVTVTMTGDMQASASPASLTFTTSNWSVAQTVTVTAADDSVAEGSHTGTIIHSASGGGYTGVSIPNMPVNITDNDTTGVTVSKSAVSLTEGGAADSYSIVLTSQPTSDVTITINGDAQASTNPTSLTFTASSWSVSQMVTVTAVNDTLVEGNHTGTIMHSAAGGGYNGISIANVTANITDNDSFGVTLSKTAVNVTEGGAADAYTVVLNLAPSADVTVIVTGNAQASVNPTSLTFTTSNWSMPQTVTVTAVNDTAVEGSHISTITHTASGGGYNGVSIANVTVNITDNDTASADTELLTNGSFEAAGSSGKQASGWKTKYLSVDNDGQVCKSDPTKVAFEGNCAFRFKFNGTIVNSASRTIKQKITDFPVTISAGDKLAFTGYVKGKNVTASAQIVIKVIYNATEKDNLKLDIPTGSYGYTVLTGNIDLKAQPAKIVVVVKSRESTGTFYVDQFSLMHKLAGSAGLSLQSASDDLMIPLP